MTNPSNEPFEDDKLEAIDRILSKSQKNSQSSIYDSINEYSSNSIKIKNKKSEEKISKKEDIKEDLVKFREKLFSKKTELPLITLANSDTDFTNLPISDERLGLGIYSSAHDRIFLRENVETKKHLYVIARHEMTHKDNKLQFLGHITRPNVIAYKQARKILGEGILDKAREENFHDYHLMKLAVDYEEDLREIKGQYMADDDKELMDAIDSLKETFKNSNMEYISSGFDEAFAQFVSMYSSSQILEKSSKPLLSPDILEDEDNRANIIEHLENKQKRDYKDAADYLETIFGVYANLTTHAEMSSEEASRYILSEVRNEMAKTEELV